MRKLPPSAARSKQYVSEAHVFIHSAAAGLPRGTRGPKVSFPKTCGILVP